MTKTQVEVENGDEEEDVAQTVSILVFLQITLCEKYTEAEYN